MDYTEPESLREALEQILEDAQGGDDAELLGPVRGHLMLTSDLFRELEHQIHHTIAHNSDATEAERCHAATHLERAVRFRALLDTATTALAQIEFNVAPLPSPDSDLGKALVAGVLEAIADEEHQHNIHHLDRCLGSSVDG
jgi:hypothetical protein